MYWVPILVSLAYLVLTPFTKVEESFNIQAAHDILYHQWNISSYDHHEFPGVVPRTFIGPLFLSLLSAPFLFVTSCLGVGTHFLAQYIVRASLCICVNLSLLRFQQSLQKSLGKSWGSWYLVVTVSQYHFLYYSSRPLPNVLAIPLVLSALSAAFTPMGSTWFLVLSGAAIIWFRTELALLLGIILIIQLLDSKIKLDKVIKVTIPAGLALIAITVIIDSLFWQRLVWPEAEVFYFNAILNKSSEWGTSPFLWYFYSALPRGLGTSVFLIPIGIFYEVRVRRLVVASLAFIIIFSFLPHKELRFVIYTFPLLNTAAASACQRLWENRNKSPLRWLLGVGVVSHLLLNFILTLFLVMVARVNYPGGEALARLHQLVPADQAVFVHIDNLSAQTGVTRFTELNSNWRYSKQENLEPGSPEMLQFTHLLVEAKSKYSANLKAYKRTHRILASVDGFSELIINYQMIPPIRIKTKPLIFIMERNHNVEVPNLPIVDEKFTPEESEEPVEDSSEVSADGIDISDHHETPSIDNEADNDLLDEEEVNASVKQVSEEEFAESKVEVNEIAREGIGAGENTIDERDDNVEQPYVQIEDDLIAMDSREAPKYDSSDLKTFVEELEEKLSSREFPGQEGQFDNALLDSEILNDIKELTNLNFKDSQPTLDELKSALKMILSDFKETAEIRNKTSTREDHENKNHGENSEDQR